MSDFLSLRDSKLFAAADVAAGTDFALINIDLSNASDIWIDSIEMNLFADIADDVNLLIGTFQIFRNTLFNKDLNIAVQLAAGITTFWEARTKQNRDHNLNRAFNSPIKLDRGFRYAVVGRFIFSVALATTANTTMQLGCRSYTDTDVKFFGQAR